MIILYVSEADSTQRFETGEHLIGRTYQRQGNPSPPPHPHNLYFIT